MTISSTTRKAGPFTGNNVTTTFAFAFKVFQASDLELVRLDLTGTESVLVINTDYTVTLNADQNSAPGGSVTLTSALPTGYKLVITSDIAALQTTDLTNQGGFYPAVITNALDKITILTQQLDEEVSRAAKLPITSTVDPQTLVDDLIRLGDSADNIDTVAGSIGDVNTVADNIADVNIAADNVADITNFADVYQGGKAAPPTLRNNGGALQKGDLYFDTTLNQMLAYSGSGWVQPVNYAAIVYNFSGTGSQTAFTLPTAPYGENNTQVYISGVYQQKNTYGVSGQTLTFVSAPPSGTDNIEVVIFSSLISGATTDAALVQYTPAGTGATARTVQARLRDSVSVKDFGAVGDGTTDDTAAIQAFFNYVTTNGIYGRLVAGEYSVSGPITITIGFKGFEIVGPGNQAVTFRTTSTFSGGTAVVSIQGTANICAWKIGGFDVRPSLAGTSGTATKGILIGDSSSTTIKINGYEYSVMANITVAGFAKCYEIVHARMIWFQSCSAWNPGFATANDCVYIWQNGGFTGDLLFDKCQFVSNYVADNTTVNMQSNVGPYNNLTGNCAIAGVKFRTCEFYSGYDSINMKVSAFALISDIWFIDGCQMDQEVNRGAYGESLNGGAAIANVHFEGMYINKSNNGSIAFASTGTFGNVNSIFVQDCFISNALGAAVSFFGAGCSDIHINDNSIVDCNFDGAAILMNLNNSNFNISNNILSVGLQNWTPYNIVYIGAGCESFVVSGNNDNDLSRIVAIEDLSGDVVKYIVNNPYYNPRPVTAITIGASPFSYKNTSGATQYVSIGGGTVTSLSLDGLGITPTTNTVIVVPQGSTLVVAYSVIPTAMSSKGF